MHKTPGFGAPSGSKAHAVVQNESVMITTGCHVGTICTIEAIPFWDDLGMSS